MRKILLLLLVLSCIACTNRNKPLPKPFSSEMLASQLFYIEPSKDTVLKTLHGSVIRIPAGSFNGNEKVKIEIKEAWTAAEILAAGLTTESNGKLLRSGGMIYINATVDDKQTELLKSVKVSIPNQYYDSAMQIFKGIETDSAGINWVEPFKPDSTEQSVNWAKGKQLFMANCAACHFINGASTGPALLNVENRGPWTDRKNLYAFIRNFKTALPGNRYVQNILNYSATQMEVFQLSDAEIDAILDYIKNESKNPELFQENEGIKTITDSVSQGSFLASDPCNMNDTFYFPVRSADQSFFNNSSSFVNPDTFYFDTLPKPMKSVDMEYLRNGFTDPNPTSGMYDFEIKTLGWYNVDAYVEGYEGSTNVKLSVQIQPDMQDMHVYLFCPRNKMLSVMNDQENGLYTFNKINGGIPLFLNDRAILFAFGSNGERMFYGISEFRIQKEQTITISVKETTAEEIRKALQSKQLEGIDLGIEKKEQQIIERECDDSFKTDTLASTK